MPDQYLDRLGSEQLDVIASGRDVGYRMRAAVNPARGGCKCTGQEQLHAIALGFILSETRDRDREPVT